MVKHPNQQYFYVIGSENNTLAPELRAQLLAKANDKVNCGGNGDASSGVRGELNGHVKMPSRKEFGYPRSHGRWASCISIVDPVGEEPQVLQTINFEGNEAAVSAAVVSFASQESESFLVIGTGKDMVPSPRQFSESYLHVYRFNEDGKELEFIHKTKVEEPPMVLLSFQGRLVAGIGKTLRIYDLGLKQLLRKAQADVTQLLIVSLQTQGNRIIVGDVQQGVTMVVFKYESNKLIPFVDDTITRWTTVTTMVDYESVAGGDKFGNIWIVRCPEKINAEADESGSEAHLLAREYLNSTPNRLDRMAHFFAQDIPTSIYKTNLVVGGQDVILWSGLQVCHIVCPLFRDYLEAGLCGTRFPTARLQHLKPCLKVHINMSIRGRSVLLFPLSPARTPTSFRAWRCTCAGKIHRSPVAITSYIAATTYRSRGL